MAKRPRSHQLEDLSKVAFKRQLPPYWVVRDKSHDYGVDQEVEIFKEDGTPTGLIFYVQLRATDDGDRSKYMDLTVEQIDYFNSLDLPTALFRYDSGTDTFRWKWHFNVDFTGIEEGQQTFRVRFDHNEIWIQNNADGIEQTLITLRRMKQHKPGEKILLNSESSIADPSETYRFDRAVDDAIASVPVLGHMLPSTETLVASVQLTQGSLRIAFDKLSSVTMEVDDTSQDGLKRDILFALCLLLSRHGLNEHASKIALALSNSGAKHRSRFLAFEVAKVISEAVVAARFATSNGIHEKQDPIYASFVDSLLMRHDEAQRLTAVALFLHEAARHALSVGRRSAAAAARYSLGNAYRASQECRLAVSNYNIARKLFPEYLKKDYFNIELAGCLFMQGRYSCAAEFYGRSFPKTPLPIDRLRYGDALLLGGKFGAAKNQFEHIASDETDMLSAGDAQVKEFICDWLMTEYGVSEFVRKASLARERSKALIARAEPSSVEFAEVLRALDPLDEISNFNVASVDAREGRFESAYARFAICAISTPDDHLAWANAMSCALNSGMSGVVVNTMAAAAMHSGPEGYASFRSLLEKQGASGEVLSGFDEVNRELTRQMRSMLSPAPIMRMLLPSKDLS